MDTFSGNKTILTLILGITCIGLTFIGFFAVTGLHEKDQLIQFRKQSDELFWIVEEQFKGQLKAVNILNSFFNASENVELDEFEAFTNALLNDFPSVQALEWVPVVPHVERELFTSQIRQHLPSFSIHEKNAQGDATPVSERDYYYPVVFLNPRQGNEAALGFDLGSEQLRKQSLTTALSTGDVFISERISLVQSDDTGYLIFQPTSNQGRSGVLVGVFRVSTIFNNIMSESSKGFNFFLYDIRNDQHIGYSKENLIFSSTAESIEDQALEHCIINSIRLSNRSWDLAICPQESFQGSPTFAYSVLLLGISLTILLIMDINNLFNQQKEVETQVKERTREIHKANQAIEKTNVAKTRFIETMSHDLKTPLNGIMGATELLYDSDVTEEQASWVGTIQHSVDYLLTTINEVLDYSKLEAKTLELNPQPAKITDIIQAAVDMFTPELKKKNLEIHVQTPDSSTPNILADIQRLQQILCNILSNAIRHTDQGFIHLRIREVRRFTHTIKYEISIKDSGAGLSEEVLEKYFNEDTIKEQRQTARLKEPGLGITISQGLTELMGGKLEAYNSPDGGACFCLSIPFNITERVAHPQEHGHEERHYGRSILLVEDNHVNQMVTQKILENLGVSVEIAENGLLALDAMKAKHYDLVLMDLQMPEMNGIEAALRIRDDLKLDTPIIAISANTQQYNIDSCMEAGMNGFIKKPLHTTVLIKELDPYFLHEKQYS